MIVNNQNIAIGIVLCTVVIISSSFQRNDKYAYHTKEEISLYKKLGGAPELIEGQNDLFIASFTCAGCHGFDPMEVAMVDTLGNDINVTDDWRATMMANAAKDPLWRAKVSHEGLVNPDFQDEIETKCTSCHTPLGHFNAKFIGEEHYTIDDLEADSIAFDGVSCNACHQQFPDSAGKNFSGQLTYDTLNLYGPYVDVFGAPMISFVGFNPVYHEYITKSEACAGCHTLLTESIDLDGNLTGNFFTEQATYHEWLNSAYNAEEGAIECQGCHMPVVNQDVIIASGNIFYTPQNPYFLHGIVGGNSYMLKILQENIDTLDLRASVTQFDTTIINTLKILQDETLDLVLTETNRDQDSIYVDIELINKAGHKIPSAYPSRRIFIQFVAISEEGDTLFRSGVLDEDYRLSDINTNTGFEPHYDLINDESEVQVYELVMGDINGDKTTVLLRGYSPIKDNRIPPLGFTSEHPAYDTTLVAGNALLDSDFNKDDLGFDGTGRDIISYHFAIDGYDGDVTINAQVYFQSVPPEWLDEMFNYDSDEIELWEYLYEGSDKMPELMVEDEVVSSIISVQESADSDYLNIFPNPSFDGNVYVQMKDGSGMERIQLYDASGKLISDLQGKRRNEVILGLPQTKGIYLLKVSSTKGIAFKKVFRF